MANITKITRRNMLTPPIIIPENSNGPVPFLLGFAHKPNIKPFSVRMGNPTYMGTTPCGDGEDFDYANDDA